MRDGATTTDQTIFAEHPFHKADDAANSHNPISIIHDRTTIHTFDCTQTVRTAGSLVDCHDLPAFCP